MLIERYYLFGVKIFSIIVICVSNGMFLKDMDESTQLSQDERLTPDIDEVVAFNYSLKYLKIANFCIYENLT